MAMTWLFKPIRPWDVDAYGETGGDAYCPDCDLGFVDIHVTWREGTSFGEAECPECGRSLGVLPPEEEDR